MLFLAQSDTTAGFLSQTPQEINHAKGREGKEILLEVDSLQTLKSFSKIPQRHKNLVRRAKKTTFIYPNKKALRVVCDELHLEFLKHFGALYSSSANPTRENFSYEFASQKAQVLIQDSRGFFQSSPSKIYKLNQLTLKRIR